VIDRINLLGHTHSVCEAEFAALAKFNGFDATTFSFADLRQALSAIDVGYRFDNIASVLDLIVRTATDMREKVMAETYADL